jgi:hypothetical protein
MGTRRNSSSNPDSARLEAPDLSQGPNRIAAWSAFHRQIEKLPEAVREVFDLLW